VARVRTAVADDHRLVLEAIGAMLEVDGEFEVVAATESGAELLRAVAQTAPELVVLDVAMPGIDGLACLQLLRERHPRVKVVMLSGVDDPRVAQRALKLGAAAFVKKDVDPRDFTGILRHVLQETVAAQPAALQPSTDEADDMRALLTPSELAVLEALAHGLANKEIAASLAIAQQTVKFHLTNLYRKLGVSNRTEAIGMAFERGLVEPDLVAV
jgi:DNA-binding NarL/FixJ family response regulator